jgi:branched-chain amino acid aminotransferase
VKYWIRDGLVDAAEATISVLDHGLTVGDGVFETAKVESGVPFALSRHLRRLASSAATLGLPVPDDDRLRRAVDAMDPRDCASPTPVGRGRSEPTGPMPIRRCW